MALLSAYGDLVKSNVRLESGFVSMCLIENSSQSNIHLRSFYHAKGDIETTRTKTQQEILGNEFGGKRVQGLVDCENGAEFKNYITKESQWPEEFRQWMATTKGRHRSVKASLQHCMLKAVRIAGGLTISELSPLTTSSKIM